MITGDHAITAAAIGAELGLGPGSVGGGELQAMTDEELSTALPNLHVFGRVTPQDKLRLVDVMQSGGAVVAMTGQSPMQLLVALAAGSATGLTINYAGARKFVFGRAR